METIVVELRLRRYSKSGARILLHFWYIISLVYYFTSGLFLKSDKISFLIWLVKNDDKIQTFSLKMRKFKYLKDLGAKIVEKML